MNGSSVSGTHLDTYYTTLTTNLAVGFDGSMIALVMVILSIFHPGRLMDQHASLMSLGSEPVIEMWPKGT
jgi:hypothetical protein